MRLSFLVPMTLALAVPLLAQKGGPGGAAPAPVMTMTIPGFPDGGQIPVKFSQVRCIGIRPNMHTVEYAGLYCQRIICGDWTLVVLSGGFWIWPGSARVSEFAEVQEEVEQPLEMVGASRR
jgi:hypothetical protein